MLTGEKVLLRPLREDDIPVLESELLADVVTWSRSDNRPWRPISPGSPSSPYHLKDDDVSQARFSAVEISSGVLAGEALVWGIDMHNRCAHVGLSLRPAFRGRGLGADIVRLLCWYGFVTRGFNRLQAETLADNESMIKVAERVGFQPEGVLRRTAWVNGQFTDLVILGLLADDWHGKNGG